MTEPDTVAKPNITLDRRAPSRHDRTLICLAAPRKPLKTFLHEKTHPMISVTAAAIRLGGSLALGAALGLLAPSAGHAAECSRWLVGGKWSAIQSNNTQADFDFTQDKGVISGSAHFIHGWERVGTIDGTVTGSTIQFTVYWSQEGVNVSNQGTLEIGEYTGTISPTGRVTGTTLDKNHPQTVATWYSSQLMICQPPPPPGATIGPGGMYETAPSPPAKPAVVLGRVHSTPDAAASPPMSICDRARAAIARNSPTAPALEHQCVVGGGR